MFRAGGAKAAYGHCDETRGQQLRWHLQKRAGQKKKPPPGRRKEACKAGGAANGLFVIDDFELLKIIYRAELRLFDGFLSQVYLAEVNFRRRQVPGEIR